MQSRGATFLEQVTIMARHFFKSWFRKHLASGLRPRRKFFRLGIEPLEERILLDAGLPPTLVVGRTLSSYTTGGIQNNQETITYTVYNEQADSLTGVLLTDKLQPGVTFQSASPLPDQSGQDLAWSLGTIGGFDRASVTLTVGLPSTVPLQLDRGAQAFATLDGGAVSNATPAAVLRQGSVDPSLLASTPDANTTDPFVQEQAAKLNYDPQAIFSFLHNGIGYNSYLGSVRGARGTLWSSAGNALDVASLGVALMRASGIPAQYEQGTLSKSQAQPLILSMFPNSFQTTGFIPAGTQTADPANDPQLLSETEQHFWLQFDTGSGMTDADPLMTGTVGQAVTASTGSFSVVPDNLREKTEIKLTAETYSLFNALLGGTGLSTQTVLDHTFNDVDLVGHPLTIGNQVSTQAQGLGITQIVYTYSPYIALGDAAFPDPGHDQTINGTSYQEVYSNADGGLDSVELTGLFLNVTLSGPQGPAETFEHTILDRIGFAARQNPNALDINIPDSNPPALIFDATTVNVLPGMQNPNVLGPQGDVLQGIQAQLQQFGTDQTATTADQAKAGPVLSNSAIGLTRSLGEQVITESDRSTPQLATLFEAVAYFDRPRVIVTSHHVVENQATQSSTVSVTIDLLNDHIRAIAFPGQRTNATIGFNLTRGYHENAIETTVGALASPDGTSVSTSAVLSAAADQGIPLAILAGSGAIARLDSFGLDRDATARMAAALQAGQVVMVPTRPPTIGGQPTIAWFQTDPVTGFTTGVMSDGEHITLVEVQVTAAILSILLASLLGNARGAHSGIRVVQEFELKLAVGIAIIQADFNLSPQQKADKIDQLKKELKHAKQVAVADLKGQFTFVLTTLGGAGSVAGLLFSGVSLAAVEALVFGAFGAGFSAGVDSGIANEAKLLDATLDPPISPALSDDNFPGALPANLVLAESTRPATIVAGNSTGDAVVPEAAVSGQLAATWSTASASALQIVSLSATSATVADAQGKHIGSGPVRLALVEAVPASVSGNNQYSVTGTGSLSFYGPAESSLGVSGNWTNYSATVTGNSVSITVTTDGLTLNGQTLAAGTYTITTTSAALAGSGQSTSPDFSGSASLSITNGTLALGSENGSITVGGSPLDLSSGATLDGYTGSLTVTANGNNTDAVTFNGNATNVLTVSASPPALTADQNTPATFQVDVNTSFADTYNLTAQAPPGWTVSIDATGKVTVTPAPGLQGGTFAVQIIAQSHTNPNLVAQTTVNLTVTPTTPGETLNVVTDPVLSVPVNGAELPTAFQVHIHNNGPAPVTENLNFGNVPSGFTLLSSTTSVTIPAGQTGIVGVYLQPNNGQVPPVGTSASFTVTATNAGNPLDVQQFNEPFTIPAVHAINLFSDPGGVNALPGIGNTATLTIANVGNVSETVTLSSTSSAGLTVGSLQTVTVAPGQTATETVSLTPAAGTALNTNLEATLTATFGPANAPLTQTLEVPVLVDAPGAQAIGSASVSAGQVSEGNLAAQLANLTTDLTNLAENTASAVFKSQVLSDLAAVAALLPADPFLAQFAAGVTTDRTEIANAVTPGDFQTAFNDLAATMTSVSNVLGEEAASGFSASLSPNSALALPTTPSQVSLVLHNAGTATTTYDISISGLPANVTASFNPKVTVLSDQILGGFSQAGVPITLTETGGSLFPTSFTVTVTPEGAPDIAQSFTGTLTVRPTFVDVTSVTANPTVAPQGTPVDVTAHLLNSINKQQQALISYTVTDTTGKVVFTSTPQSLTLNVVSLLSTVDLGSFPTTGLANGVYTATVTITQGNLIPGGKGTGTVLVGTAVSATLTTAPTTLPPGNGTVTSTFQVNSLAGAVQTATVTVPTTSGVSIVPGSFNIAPTTITPHSNGTEDLTWDFSALPSPKLWLTGVSFPPDAQGRFGEGIGTFDLASRTAALVEPTQLGLGGPLTFDNNGDIIYSLGFGQLELVNPATNTFTPIATGFAPDDIELEPGGNSVLVADFSNERVARVDLTTGAVSTLGPTGGEFFPSQIAYDPQGNLFLLAFGPGVRLLQLDPTSGAVLRTIPLPANAAEPEGITYDPVTNALWLSNINLSTGGGLIEVSNYLTSPQVQYFPVSPPVIDGDYGQVRSDGQGNLFFVGNQILEYNIASNTYHVLAPTPGFVGGLAPLIGLGSPPKSETFTWQSTVSNLQVGEVRPVALGATVNFRSQGSPPGTLTLPGTNVTGAQVLALSPASQTVAPASPAAYTVTVSNPGNAADTFNLAVLGVPASFVNLPGSVTVPANSSVPVTLTLTSDVLATLGDHGFTVTAQDAAGASAFVQGDLILAGQPPAPPDIEAHGVVVTLTPAQASAGQGTAARYLVQVTNTGSADDTFTLATAGLPANVTAALSQTTVVVPPGTSSALDVALTLTPAAGTAAGSDPFSVTATSMTNPAITATADGTLTVLGNGVGVTLNPPSGAPGNGFQLTVTNSGTTQDTFDLSLAGPAALVASLGMPKVTLAPGASQMVPIATGLVNFADPGALLLTGMATSESNPAVQATASAALTIAGSTGLTAELSPPVQVLPVPGTTSFLVLVHNTGNTADSYSATITGTSGPVTASLLGLDGNPTQTVPVFQLPGLSSGALVLNTNLAAFGQGTATVRVQSQTDPSIVASSTATVSAAAVVVSSPGTVQFSAASFSATEEGGAAPVTLTRTGGSSGAVSVVVSTADGSGIAGQDYVPVSQVVSWADGDTTPKTVSIPLNDDNLVEGNETVRLALSNPGGGASVGNQGSAVLTILEDQEPPPPKLSLTRAVEHSALVLTLAGAGFTKGSVVVVRGHFKGQAFTIRLKTKFLGGRRVRATVPKFLPSSIGAGLPTVEENNDLTFSVQTPGGVETASQRFLVLEEVRPHSAGTVREQAAVVAFEALNSGHEFRLNQIPKSFLKQFFATFGGRPGG
jgi:hypothetical protein